MTVTGLNPILMHTLSAWQCSILFFLSTIGSTSFVSLVTIVVRKFFFLKHFHQAIENERIARREARRKEAALEAGRKFKGAVHRVMANARRASPATPDEQAVGATASPTMYTNSRNGSLQSLTVEMIRRVGTPVRVDNSGRASRASGETTRNATPNGQMLQGNNQEANSSVPAPGKAVNGKARDPKTEDSGVPIASAQKDARVTIRMADTPTITLSPLATHANSTGFNQRHHTSPRQRRHTTGDLDVVRTLSRNPNNVSMNSGLGGFKNPLVIILKQVVYLLKHKTLDPKLQRTTTLRGTQSQGGLGGNTDADEDEDPKSPSKSVNYISFDAIVGRNSRFLSLTSEQRDELGGVEYRALRLLLNIVVAYILLVQLIPMAIFCPLFASSRYASVLEAGGVKASSGAFMAAFTINSAFTNSGFTLFDASMVAVQGTYGWVILVALEILAGNIAFPILLRLVIWLMSKVARRNSRTHESLTFLLDHPRRCYMLLFPAYQTWFLTMLLFLFNGFEWICFTVLDRRLPVYDSLSGTQKAISGFFQTASTRSAGYAILNLRDLAPAQQLIIIVMMFVSVYPIAVSIRSTNVYEEKSLGVYAPEDTEDLEEPAATSRQPFAYLYLHARRQLAFDAWWLMFAIWIICICERSKILDTLSREYINIFSVLFEIVSAYGTVGLSLGSPVDNWSLCREFNTLSKFILCCVMLRGRHRGMPVAIDRSVLLPADIEALAVRNGNLGQAEESGHTGGSALAEKPQQKSS